MYLKKIKKIWEVKKAARILSFLPNTGAAASLLGSSHLEILKYMSHFLSCTVERKAPFSIRLVTVDLFLR